MKIVLAEKVSPATLAVFQQEPGWNVVTPDQIKNGLAAELADADALVVRSAVQADAKLLESAPKLRVIGRAGVGVDNIDTDAATRQGIVVMNTPGANAVAVAELTLGLMISMGRSIPRANATMHAGKWEKKSLQGQELRGKTLGIVGLGRIGLEVARRARAFGMELIGYDPFIAPVIARENDVTLVPIDEIFKESDYLTLHVGLTTQTEGLINATSLAIMKKGIRIVNCARGELIVEEALAEALKSGKVAGAALDVFHQEPLKESPFHNLDNVILSPHIAGATDEAQEAIGIQLAMQVRDYLKLGVVQNAVNLPSLSHEEYIEVAPYIEMAERLGHFLSHATPGNLENIQITYTGRIASGRLTSSAMLPLPASLRIQKQSIASTQLLSHRNAAFVFRKTRRSSQPVAPVRFSSSSCIPLMVTPALLPLFFTVARRACSPTMASTLKRLSTEHWFRFATTTFLEWSDASARFWASTRLTSRTSRWDALFARSVFRRGRLLP